MLWVGTVLCHVFWTWFQPSELVGWVGIMSSLFPRPFFFSMFFLFQDVFCVFFSGGFVFRKKKNMLNKTNSTNIKFLMKLQLINSTKTKSNGSPWATQIFNDMFLGGVFYCALLFLMCFCFFQKSLYPFLWYGYCNLLSFHLASSECQFPENINVLIKYTIFSGGSPWATHIFNSLCVFGGRYYVQLFPGWFFFKILLSCPLL